MKIAEIYSHLNGLEYLLVHKKKLWKELKTVISSVDAEKCKTKKSKEKTKRGKTLYSPIDMNEEFKTLLNQKNWKESRVNYWITKNEKLITAIFSTIQAFHLLTHLYHKIINM